MAFNDLPQIDNASRNDDEAKTAFARLFAQKAGFIPREQNPDKGCDFLVELITDLTGATNWNFSVQLKSIENTEPIKKGEFISYPFATSRLGYLMRNQPIYGILVLYDVSSETAYYEYADELYGRLMKERENEEWKNNEKVNVHIPATKVLDANSLKTIHQTFYNRFTNLARMNTDHGSTYNLPVHSASKSDKFDFDKVEDVIKILKRWGISSVVLGDMAVISGLLAKVPNNDIVADKDLLLLAALSYSETGKIAESAYYTDRLHKRFALSPGEQIMIDYIALKNQLSLGSKGPKEFIEEAKAMLTRNPGLQNEITLRLNILYYELSSIRGFEPMPELLVEEISSLAEIIEKLEESTSKYYNKIWNLENLALLLGHLIGEGYNEMSVREAFSMPLSREEVLLRTRRLIGLQSMFNREMIKIDGYAEKHQDFLLQAYAIHVLIRYQLGQMIKSVTYEAKVDHSEEQKSILSHYIGLADYSFTIFIQNNLLRQAYNLLCQRYELLVIWREWFGFGDPADLEIVQRNLSFLEHDLELPPYQAKAEKLIHDKRNCDNSLENGMRGLLNFNMEQIETFADMVLSSGKYPNAKKGNMIGEMLGYKMFYQRCTNPDIEVNTVKPADIRFAYVGPTRFILKNKRSGLISIESPNMDRLLSSWGF